MARVAVVPIPGPPPGRSFIPRKGEERRGGRQRGTPNRRTVEITELSIRYGTEALATLVELMRHSADEDIVFRCSTEILNRAYGKAPQSVRIGGPQGEPLDLTRLDDAALERLLIRLEQSIAGTSAADDPSRESRASEATEVDARAIGFSQPPGGDQSEV
jgi:hypothetical protein